MEEFLHTLTAYIALIVEAIAVVIIAAGALGAAVALVRVDWRHTGHGARKQVWRQFALSLLVGLEFELAADILRSVISPDWQEIGQLAAIAGIRTFLNYFLEKDLAHSSEPAP